MGAARHAEEDACPLSAPGLVVEAVAPESPGLRAGLMPGDRLLSWCRTRGGTMNCVARGAFRTPFGWRDVEMEEIQRGGVFIEGTRGTKKLRWHLLPASQGLTVAPLLHGALAEAYQASRDRRQAGDPASVGLELEQAAELAASENRCADVELWLRAQAAHFRTEARQWPEVDAGYQTALEKARANKAVRVEAHLHLGWWQAFWQRGELMPARQQLESALRLFEKDQSASLSIALVLIRLSATAYRQEGLEETDRLSRRAYDVARRAAPGSGAEAAAANNLAAILATRGDLAQAELYLARTLAIQEKLAPAGEGIVMNLWNYGKMLSKRGDFAGAEAAFLRAKKILENIKPESNELAITLHYLGEIADERGDRDAAESYFRRELSLVEKLDPDGSQTRERLTGLGKLALLQNQGDKAEELWQRALAISQKLNPKGLTSASCLVGLAEAMSLQGRSSEAETLLQRALAIWQGINPEAIDTGSLHLKVGLLLLARGDIETSEAHLRTAIRIREKSQAVLPESYQALARVQVRRGQAEEAAVSYLAAVDALEAQRSRLGGAQESQWLYGSSLGDLYFEAAEHQIALGRPLEAWMLVERGRARGFQELLAQRDLRFAGELPAALYAERHRLTAQYDQTQAALADWLPEQGPEKLEELQGRLRDLRLELAELQERILSASPRIRALERSTPLNLAAARAALDPGTVLLTYAVGESRSYLFVIEAVDVSGPGLSFHPLTIGREDLEQEVESFRSLVGRPRTLLAALKERGRHLYDLLLRPAEPVLAKADRLLISPNGPLHSLPFAALVSGDRYLAESKPIHITASAAVYKEIKATRSEKQTVPTLELLAAGDPFYPARLENRDEAADPQLRTALRRGLKLKPLPASRREVEAISKLFPGGRTLLSRDATEEAIKSLAPKARRLHLATHGLLDERFPLNSALALTVPETQTVGRENGLLQAWEIFESVRLDADLVTLSACDTALGKEVGGEGLVGLTRAFQYAGARSVLASLWSISDVSTARFMESFYGHLRRGKPKDEALRAAQIEQIREKSGSSHPFHWAAFELFGDWR
jgi:CHAT domain-containing protein/Tfp pilus assembly protein PilF